MRRCSLWRPALAVLALALLPGSGLTQESWVGKTILTKKYGVKIGHTDDDGRQVYVATLVEMSYKVREDEGGWIKVATGYGYGVQGWFDKADAVLLEDAVTYFTAVLQKNPNDAATLFKRAYAWQLKGELDIAIKEYGEVLRLDPRPGVYWFRGNAWKVKKEYDKAIADYNETIRLDPNYDAAFNHRSHAWRAKKEYDKAIADLNEALRLNPKSVAVYISRGSVWCDKNEYDKASADYNEAIRLNPRDARAWSAKAWLLSICPDERLRDGNNAVAMATKALALADKKTDFMESLAAAFAEAGDFAKAVYWQEKALADPGVRDDEKAQGRLELYRQQRPYRHGMTLPKPPAKR